MIAHFHSTNTNNTMHMPPKVIIEMAIGLSHAKYVPPPEIGIKSIRITEECKKTPE
jgi:hypothetical protein